MATVAAQGRVITKPRSKRRSPFWLVAAVAMLLLTFVGFSAFYLTGRGVGGREIDPSLLPLVAVHGAALTAWMGLLVTQSGLVMARSVRLHMTIGRWAMPLVALCALSGVAVAVQSVRLFPNGPFWGMPYWQFLLPMLAEMVVFSGFVIAGYVNRRRPYRHRAMMMLSGLAILAGATARIRSLQPIFGDSGWSGLFGPLFVLGLAGLAIHSLVSRSFDRWLGGGLLVMATIFVLADTLAVTSAWRWTAIEVFGIAVA